MLEVVAASLLTALVLKLQGVPGALRVHNRRAAEVNEDLLRWIRDRGRVLEQELATLGGNAARGELSTAAAPSNAGPAAGSQLHSGGYVRVKAEVKRRALHE